MDRYGYALERCVHVEHELAAVPRSCFQRLYETNRFMEKLLQGTGGSVNLPAALKACTPN